MPRFSLLGSAAIAVERGAGEWASAAASAHSGSAPRAPPQGLQQLQVPCADFLAEDEEGGDGEQQQHEEEEEEHHDVLLLTSGDARTSCTGLLTSQDDVPAGKISNGGRSYGGRSHRAAAAAQPGHGEQLGGGRSTDRSPSPTRTRVTWERTAGVQSDHLSLRSASTPAMAAALPSSSRGRSRAYSPYLSDAPAAPRSGPGLHDPSSAEHDDRAALAAGAVSTSGVGAFRSPSNSHELSGLLRGPASCRDVLLGLGPIAAPAPDAFAAAGRSSRSPQGSPSSSARGSGGGTPGHPPRRRSIASSIHVRRQTSRISALLGLTSPPPSLPMPALCSTPAALPASALLSSLASGMGSGALAPSGPSGTLLKSGTTPSDHAHSDPNSPFHHDHHHFAPYHSGGGGGGGGGAPFGSPVAQQQRQQQQARGGGAASPSLPLAVPPAAPSAGRLRPAASVPFALAVAEAGAMPAPTIPSTPAPTLGRGSVGAHLQQQPYYGYPSSASVGEVGSSGCVYGGGGGSSGLAGGASQHTYTRYSSGPVMSRGSALTHYTSSSSLHAGGARTSSHERGVVVGGGARSSASTGSHTHSALRVGHGVEFLGLDSEDAVAERALMMMTAMQEEGEDEVDSREQLQQQREREREREQQAAAEAVVPAGEAQEVEQEGEEQEEEEEGQEARAVDVVAHDVRACPARLAGRPVLVLLQLDCTERKRQELRLAEVRPHEAGRAAGPAPACTLRRLWALPLSHHATLGPGRLPAPHPQVADACVQLLEAMFPRHGKPLVGAYGARRRDPPDLTQPVLCAPATRAVIELLCAVRDPSTAASKPSAAGAAAAAAARSNAASKSGAASQPGAAAKSEGAASSAAANPAHALLDQLATKHDCCTLFFCDVVGAWRRRALASRTRERARGRLAGARRKRAACRRVRAQASPA